MTVNTWASRIWLKAPMARPAMAEARFLAPGRSFQSLRWMKAKPAF